MRRRAVALAIVVSSLLPGCGIVGGGGDTYTLTAWFPRAVSLYPESDVRVLGLDAGSIRSVEPHGDAVKVVLEVDEEVPVPADVRAMIVPLSLIGERYIQLFPVWRGGPKAADGDEIPLERTAVPVEPDEALEALKRFLDSLDPDATGRLVQNLADGLEGQGPSLNDALAGLATLTGTLADRDQELARLIEQFDRFTATLATREQELGQVLDAFAATTSVLAAERREIEGLIRGLASTSSDLLDLTSEHGARLDRDLTVLTRTLQSARVNIEEVEKLLDTAPVLTDGLYHAWAPEQHRIDLRNQYSPTAGEALDTVAPGLADNIVCLPVDVSCPPGAVVPSPASAGAGESPASWEAADEDDEDDGGGGGGGGGPFGFLRRAARSVVGAVG